MFQSCAARSLRSSSHFIFGGSMFFSFIRRYSCIYFLFFLSACGGGSGDGGSTGNTAASVVSSNEQILSDPTTSSSNSSSTPSSPSDTPCTKIQQSPCSGGTLDPALTANVAPSEPLPKNNCYGDASVQCSGASNLHIDNHIAVTASGMHTYGVSNPSGFSKTSPVNPVGLMLASGGTVEVRSGRGKNSAPSDVALIMSNLGLSWDGTTERPQIIETFSSTSKRVELSSSGFLLNKDLPALNDVSFFDFALRGTGATQSHYANNVYFPRPQDAACSNVNACLLTESPPLVIEHGDWKTGGNQPDKLVASHAHLDGAVEVSANNTTVKSDSPNDSVSIGTPTILGGLTPGAQGYRTYTQWSYGWSNLGVWATQDIVNTPTWGGSREDKKLISGTVAFGTVSIPDRIPVTGTAIYSGNVYGWLSYDPTGSSVPFFANATVTVNFANNTAEFLFSKTRIIEKDYSDIFLPPVQTTLSLDRQKFRNYLNGRLDFASMQGGVGARFFGPITTGGSGIAPVEMAGSFNMQCAQASDCFVLVGGFLLKKQ
jgi:hypothetical protein